MMTTTATTTTTTRVRSNSSKTNAIFSLLLLTGAHAFNPVAISSIVRGHSTIQHHRHQQNIIIPMTISKPQKDKVLISALSLSSSAVPLDEPDAAVAAQQASKKTTTSQTAQQVDVLQRSSVAAISCVTTWAMATHIPGMNAIQASSLQGLIACSIPGLVPGPFCAASFCGSFAGMSAQTVTIGEASQLGFLCSVVYYFFERPNKKLQLGKGGRLGTIAFLANVLYFGIRQGSSQFSTLLVDVFNVLRPSTIVAVIMAATVLNKARSSLVQEQEQRQQQQASQVSSSSSSNSNSGSVMVATRSTGVVAQKMLATASKGAIIAALLARLLQTTSSAGTTTHMTTLVLSLAKSTLAMFAAGLVVQKFKPLNVLPVALIGLVGGTFLESLAAPLYLGAFIGMTGLSQFTTSPVKFLQASIMSSLLLQLGLFAGFGGKLGFLAFVGVNFGL